MAYEQDIVTYNGATIRNVEAKCLKSGHCGICKKTLLKGLSASEADELLLGLREGKLVLRETAPGWYTVEEKESQSTKVSDERGAQVAKVEKTLHVYNGEKKIGAPYHPETGLGLAKKVGEGQLVLEWATQTDSRSGLRTFSLLAGGSPTTIQIKEVAADGRPYADAFGKPIVYAIRQEQSDSRWSTYYRVGLDLYGKPVSCECEDYKNRRAEYGGSCKHMNRVSR